MNNTIIILIIIGIILLLIGLTIPSILKRIGLYPDYNGKVYHLSRKKALIITTSHDKLGYTGKRTGVYACEMTIPYYQFLNADMEVDVASIKGGKIPIESKSVKWPLKTKADKRFLKDQTFLAKCESSLKIDDVDFKQYDLVFMAGGCGAAYDLGFSDVLGEKIAEADASGAILGSVCQGALGFLKAKDIFGVPLIKSRHLTSVTNKQLKEFGFMIIPQHPETELKRAGAIFESKTAFKDFFANLTVVDGNIVTGQNQNAGKEAAQMMLKLLNQKIKLHFPL